MCENGIDVEVKRIPKLTKYIPLILGVDAVVTSESEEEAEMFICCLVMLELSQPEQVAVQ